MTFDPDLRTRGYVHGIHANRFDPTCRRRYILVVIHPNAADLRAEATRYSREQGSSQTFDDALGTFQTTPHRSRYDRRARKWVDSSTSFAGIMRLSRPDVTREHVAHECAHAALHLTRLHDWSKDDHPGDAVLEDMETQEEPFCYLLGELVSTVQRMVDEALA